MESAKPRDYCAVALAYAEAAARDRKGKRYCRWVRLAAERHLRDLKRYAEGGDYLFDPWHGNDVCDFLEKLPHVAGQWGSRTIELDPYQVFILVAVFGWRRRSDGGRRFSYAYIEVARKAAKSTLTAGVALYCLTCEGERGPEIVIGATTGEQAQKVFKPAQGMVRATPDLQEAFGLQALARSIVCGQNGGWIQPINAKGKTQDGWNPHLGILDELHAHKDRALFDVIRSAFGARSNPLMWIITTAGFDTNGVCYEQRQFITKVLEGVIDAEHAFGIVYTIDEGDDPFDERTWIKSNPMLGVTPSLASMRSEATEAKASPSAEGNFKTKRLNVWLNAAGAWLNIERWRACADTALDWKDFEGLDCFVGGDLADKDDITALVLAAFDTAGCLLLKPMFWLPEGTLNRPEHLEGRGVAPYRAWRDKGHLKVTPGDWVDHGEVEQVVRDWAERFGVRGITFDQFAAAQLMASRLNEDLGGQIAKILHKSAPNVTDPAKELEARVNAGPHKLRHDGNPVMTWMASNVVVTRHVNGSIIPKKANPMSPLKIDGIDAAINAIAPMGTPAARSVYEERGVLVL